MCTFLFSIYFVICFLFISDYVWERLTSQRMTTFNLLCQSNINQNLSKEEKISDTFYFNKIPIAHRWTKVLVYETPTERRMWDTYVNKYRTDKMGDCSWR